VSQAGVRPEKSSQDSLTALARHRFLGEPDFPLSEREYLEHLEFIAQKLIEWDQVSCLAP
jgi:hypothetical protein